MATRKTEIQKAIESTEAEMRVLQQVLDRLKQQQAAKPTRKPRAKAVADRAAVLDGDGR